MSDDGESDPLYSGLKEDRCILDRNYEAHQVPGLPSEWHFHFLALKDWVVGDFLADKDLLRNSGKELINIEVRRYINLAFWEVVRYNPRRVKFL